MTIDCEENPMTTTNESAAPDEVPNDPELDVWTAAANLSTALRRYGDCVRDDVWRALLSRPAGEASSRVDRACLRERVTCAVDAALPGSGGNYQIDRVVDAVLATLPRSSEPPSREQVSQDLHREEVTEQVACDCSVEVVLGTLIERGWLHVRDDEGGRK